MAGQRKIGRKEAKTAKRNNFIRLSKFFHSLNKTTKPPKKRKLKKFKREPRDFIHSIILDL